MLELVVKCLPGTMKVESRSVGIASIASQLIALLSHPGVSQGALTYQGTCTWKKLASVESGWIGLQSLSSRRTELSLVILNR